MSNLVYDLHGLLNNLTYAFMSIMSCPNYNKLVNAYLIKTIIIHFYDHS